MGGLNELLGRYLRDGDAAAMEQIVAKTRGRLLSAARRIGSPQDAEDSVQATYHALLRRGDQSLDAPLIAWLLTVVVRIAYRRKALDQRQKKLAERLALPGEEAGPLRRAEHTERGEVLRAEVASLPSKYRDVLVLRYFEGLTRAECAALSEVSEETVKTRLRRARDLLRSRLNPRMRRALMVGPWFLADTALSYPAMGVVMKSKVTIVAALIALIGLIAVGTNALRTHETDGPARVDPAPEESAHREKPKPEPNPDSLPESGPTLRETFDLTAADRDRDVHGVVVKEDGSPVKGARLSLVRYPWRRANTLNSDQYHAAVSGPEIVSARDGTFVLPWKRGRMGQLRIEADGLARRWVDDVQAGEKLRIVMDEGATVNVRVVDTGDAELSGVDLVLRGSAGRDPEPWAQRATTGSDGRAKFEAVAGNRRYWIEARHDEYGSPGWARINAPGGGGSVSELIKMRKLRVVTGRLTDSETGAPIANARVGMHWSQRGAVRTDADGRYELSTWRGETVRTVVASAAGYGLQTAELAASEVVDFVLEHGDRVTGRVVDADGGPIAGVRIAALGTVMRETSITSRGYAVSAVDGAFAIDGLRHEAIHTVAFYKEDIGRMLRDIDPPERAGGLVEMGEVVLRPGRSIEGRVLDVKGQPVARVPVTLMGANFDRGAKRVRAVRRYGTHGEQEMRHTDDLGRFRFPDLSPGTYRIAAQRSNSTPVEVKVKLTAGVDRTGVEIQFDATREVVVVVTGPEGEAVPDAFFSVQHEGGVQSARTNAEGRAVLSVKGVLKLLQLSFIQGLDDDVAYELPVKREDIGLDQGHLEIELRRAGVVRGVVLYPDGKPVYKPLIQVQRGKRTFRSAFGGEDGTFRAEVPLDGPCDLVFLGFTKKGERSTEMNSPFEGKLEGVVAGARDVTLTLRAVAKNRTVRVRVVDADGKPMAKMRVFTAQHKRFVLTDDDGRVTLEGMVAKATLVHAFPDQENAPGLVPPPGVEVVPGGQEVEIKFLRGVALRGSVVRPAGTTGPCFVVIYSGDRTVATANCDDKGAFEAFLHPAVGDGPFRIQAIDAVRRKASGAIADVKGVMVGGPEPRIELTATDE